jgi:tRNA-binding protein
MAKTTGAIPDRKQKITFGKFENVDMRVGRVLAAPLARGSRFPSRVIQVDLGPLGTVQSVGQYALLDESDLVGKNVVVCVNLGSREMGDYVSDALLLGVPHPDSPDAEAQATPLWADERVAAGNAVY